MVKVNESGKYIEMLEVIALDNENLEVLIEKKVKRFKKNPDDTRLRNHALTRRMEGKWAFSVTDDIRIVYEWIGKDTARFHAIGPHVEVYKK